MQPVEECEIAKEAYLIIIANVLIFMGAEWLVLKLGKPKWCWMNKEENIIKSDDDCSVVRTFKISWLTDAAMHVYTYVHTFNFVKTVAKNIHA